VLKAIAFDFDGVLLESVDVKTQAFRTLFSGESPSVLNSILQYHIDNGGVSRFEKFRFIYKNILKRPLSENTFHHLCDRFARLVVDEVVASPWVPGAHEFLQENKGKYQLFVVSATPDNEIKQIIARRKIQSFFTAVMGSPRTKTILLKDLLTLYNLASKDMVYIGDAVNDWTAAREMGIPFIWRRSDKEKTMLPGFNGPWLQSLDRLADYLIPLQIP
jgi:phosphoglycolate phosphatase